MPDPEPALSDQEGLILAAARGKLKSLLGKKVSRMLPNKETLYAALLCRDTAFDGKVWVCVRTTGIYCRLSCPSRKPLARNCDFQASIQDCVKAGFRACKRCAT